MRLWVRMPSMMLLVACFDVDTLHNGDDEAKSQRERNKQKVIYGGERKLRSKPIDRSDFRHFIPLSNLK